jgi:hypothetical protein
VRGRDPSRRHGELHSEAVVEVRHEQENNLVWALIDAAKPDMSAGECNYAVVTLVAGDSFAAIRQLLRLIATKHIPLRPHLVQLCARWLDAYVFHEEYEHLRGLIEGFLMPQAIQASLVIRGQSTMPGHGPVVHRQGRRTTASGCVEDLGDRIAPVSAHPRTSLERRQHAVDPGRKSSM